MNNSSPGGARGNGRRLFAILLSFLLVLQLLPVSVFAVDETETEQVQAQTVSEIVYPADETEDPAMDISEEGIQYEEEPEEDLDISSDPAQELLLSDEENIDQQAEADPEELQDAEEPEVLSDTSEELPALEEIELQSSYSDMDLYDPDEPGYINEDEDLLSEEEIAEMREAAKNAKRRKSSGLTVLTFTSDIHNNTANTAADRLNTWLTRVEGAYGSIDAMGYCGDMGHANTNESQFWDCTRAVMDVMDNHGITTVYTTGNHEFYNGKYSTTSSSVKNEFIVDQEGLPGDNYIIYCLGTDNWNNNRDNYTTEQVNKLSSFLDSADPEKPIIILTHFPLHRYSSRSTANADIVIDTLNDAVDAGKKIVLLWGHNHSMSDTNYDEIFGPDAPSGDVITYNSSNNTKKIKFYYAAAGCMSDTEYTGSSSVKGKGLVLTINSSDQLSFTYYDVSLNNVTEGGGTFSEQDPVDVTGVHIEPPATAEVEVGKTLSLKAAVEPADATDKSVTWSSSDTAVATVSSEGKVKGVAEDTVTITVSAGKEGTKAIYTDEIEITVNPRSDNEQYYIIKIDNYALSSHASSEITSNSSGYEYHGLQAAPYDADSPAPLDILWMLEEVDGVENGYYIKSYNGEYLSATYVRGSGSGYTGTLTVGETQDVWIVNSGLEAWEGNGSYLKSTNASDNPRPAEIYLTTRLSNNNVDFFTVGSSSSYEISQLVEPSEIVQPVAVTGITLSPTYIEIEAGRSAQITANVMPENADDKTVTWASSDESVATVDNNGRVRGIVEGTATISATTNDGGFTAECTVDVTPSSSPGLGYVIAIGDYALSTEPSPDTLINSGSGSQQYTYTGLLGVVYDADSQPAEDILWLIEPTADGYYIMSLDGRYLNATYGSNSTGGNTGELKLDDTPDVWSFEGSLEDWVLSGSTLHSANADKYLTHEEGSTSAPLNLFTVRSTGESSSIIDPDNPAEVRFVETDSFSDGKDYIIAATKDGSSVYAIENVSGTSSGDTGTATLVVTPAAGNDAAYIVTDNTGVVWRYTSSNRYLTNSTRMLSRGGSSESYVPRASGSGSAVTYSSNNKRLSISYRNTTYYLTNSNGSFGLNSSSSSAAQIRLFEKATVFNFKYVVQFVSNGVNYYSGKYAAGEIPVYTGATPTRAETDLYTYTFSGWSSDGGATTYGPDEALPAVTGATTYVAQFTANPKPQGYTITWVNYDGTVLETDENVEYGVMPSYDGEEPVKEGDAQYSYEFTGWDPEITTVSGDKTYTAQFDQSVNSYTITWDIEGEKTSETYAYGATPSYKGEEPVKEGDAQYSYEFTGWSPEVVAVAGEATYTATFSSTPRTYGEPVWTWSGDEESGFSASATFTTNDGGTEFSETVDATVTSAPGTGEYEGKIVYTATVEFKGSTYTNVIRRGVEAGMLGDVNLDGSVDAADLTALARHVSNIERLTDPEALANADVTGEGDISAADLTRLARYVAKIINEL